MSKQYYERVLKGTGVQTKKFHSNIGSSILKKFGWEEGEGLGKDRTGPTDPLQIRRRADLLGLGAEKPQQSGNQWNNWWDDLYNTTASNLSTELKPIRKLRSKRSRCDSLETRHSDSSSSTTSCHSTERTLEMLDPTISTSAGLERIDAKEFKRQFLSGNSLKADEAWTSEDTSIEKQKRKIKSNENKPDELLEACNGRTCRKAERQKGKLKRIKLAEKALLRKMNGMTEPPISAGTTASENSDSVDMVIEINMKKRCVDCGSKKIDGDCLECSKPRMKEKERKGSCGSEKLNEEESCRKCPKMSRKCPKIESEKKKRKKSKIV